MYLVYDIQDRGTRRPSWVRLHVGFPTVHLEGSIDNPSGRYMTLGPTQPLSVRTHQQNQVESNPVHSDS